MFGGFEGGEELDPEFGPFLQRVARVGENFCYMMYNMVDSVAYCVGLSKDG